MEISGTGRIHVHIWTTIMRAVYKKSDAVETPYGHHLATHCLSGRHQGLLWLARGTQAIHLGRNSTAVKIFKHFQTTSIYFASADCWANHEHLKRDVLQDPSSFM